ncbi:hypothetical protein SAMN05216475_2283 [Pseudomonas synxantha]|uniref:Uncharacterized protein n=1 Tax=Pseudomonas synxantha TaxID=47883 RepID=A0AAX3I6S4_9PSED|nr:hypothetical protein [Pseudomonas synxantha]AZE67081.1 hypothetical protein C4K01_2886 [Pseudomonas synxantha]KRP56019.1 hypothetical protein TU77_06935 [Pseudomonas synxantha]MDQ0981117.1 hypothetical protein [Pseudomonas synxantha]SDU30460.1 hypothetical protein SAMN05216475_2283 [Pseudomonas synxantha]VTQ99617.1 Uncharacterised protein [Pseudomonas synxantha]
MTKNEDPQTDHRNDPAIDAGEPAPGTAADAPKDPKADSDPKAKENDYSPDFKPEREPKPETDADIDTQGG